MKKHPIGINMLLWTDSPSEKTFPLFEQVREVGYDLVEFSIYSQSEATMNAMGKKLDELGLLRTVVTTCGEEDNPASLDKAIRKNAEEVLKKRLDLAAAAGATTIVGPIHSTLGGFSGKAPTEEEKAYAAETIRPVAEHAQKVGVKLALEPINRFECYLMNDAEAGVDMVKRVDHPYCQLMYDTFHSHIEEKSIKKAVDLVKDCLIHVHISENDRSTPGKGQVNWKESFDSLFAIGYEGPMVIEAFGSALPNLVAATKIWRRMFADEMTLAKEGLAFIKQQLEARK